MDGRWRLLPDRLQRQVLNSALSTITALEWKLDAPRHVAYARCFEAIDGEALFRELRKTNSEALHLILRVWAPGRNALLGRPSKGARRSAEGARHARGSDFSKKARRPLGRAFKARSATPRPCVQPHSHAEVQDLRLG